MRIIFMGTPEFAVASLKALVDNGEHVVAVVTSPDKPAGRGQKIHQSAVKEFAVGMGIPVMQPAKLRDPEFVEKLKSYRADLQVVVAFRMLPEIVWNMPPKGTINVHGSLLPNYRGAAPINHAVINGEKETGVSTFLLRHEIDTGNILFSASIDIEDDDNAGSVHDKLMELGASTLLKTIDAIKNNNVDPIPQTSLIGDPSSLKHAPKIFKEDCMIDWSRPAIEIHNLIRGLSPYPAAFTKLDNKTLKIFKSKILDEESVKEAGTFETDGKSYLKFAAADQFVDILELQIEGKKKMNVKEFLRGYHF